MVEDEGGFLFGREAVLDEGEIRARVGAVKFVAHDGMADGGQVDAELMLAAGARGETDEGEVAAIFLEMAFDGKFGLRGGAVGAGRNP